MLIEISCIALLKITNLYSLPQYMKEFVSLYILSPK